MVGLSVLRVVSNDQMVRDEEAASNRALEDRQNTELILGLTSYLRQCWDAARIAKKPIEDIMLRALRQRAGQYEADKLRQIQGQGGSEVYMMLTEVKCRGAESWLRDILLDTGTPPWDLTPTPIPDLSPEQSGIIQQIFADKVLQAIQATQQAPSIEEMEELKEVVSQDYRFRILQDAQNRADKMKIRINDQFAQGGWPDAFNDFITDLVTYPCAFVKGPIVRRQRMLGWTKGPDGATMVEGTDRLGPEYERVNPFNMYPEPGVTKLNDGYLFQHHPMSRTQLADLIGVPGYDDDAIPVSYTHLTLPTILRV